MLPDLERKLLRMLINYPMHRNRMPTFKQLEIMSGRYQSEIIKGLKSLEEQGFITWPDKSSTASIKVLKEHEIEQESYIDYWTLF